MKKSAKIVRIKCCAFCGLTQYQVPVLIQGPAIGFESHVHICGACVGVCAEIVLEDKKLRAGTVQPEQETASPSVADTAPPEPPSEPP